MQQFLEQNTFFSSIMADVEIELTDENDWVLSMAFGSNSFAIHPADDEYNTFVVQRWTEFGFDHVTGPATIEEVLKLAA